MPVIPFILTVVLCSNTPNECVRDTHTELYGSMMECLVAGEYALHRLSPQFASMVHELTCRRQDDQTKGD